MRENVRRHYKGKDYIKGSGNDTHLDSTYHSNMECRDYDTISSKPSDSTFEDGNYDESIVKGNEEIRQAKESLQELHRKE